LFCFVCFASVIFFHLGGGNGFAGLFVVLGLELCEGGTGGTGRPPLLGLGRGGLRTAGGGVGLPLPTGVGSGGSVALFDGGNGCCLG